MSSTPDDTAETSSLRSTATQVVAGLPVPQSTAFWLLVGVSLALIATGLFVVSGELTGLFGLWGISLFVAIVLVYVVYGLWSYMG